MRPLWLAWLALALSLIGLPAEALTPEQALRIAAGESDSRIAALNEVVAAGDPGLVPFLQAVLADEVKIAAGKAYIVRDGKTVEAGSGAAATLPAGAEDVVNNNRMRREMETALAAVALFSPDVALRAKAIGELRDQVDEGKLALLEKAEAQETDPALKAQLGVLKSAVLISSNDKDKRIAAAKALAGSHEPATRSLLLSTWVPRVMPR